MAAANIIIFYLILLLMFVLLNGLTTTKKKYFYKPAPGYQQYWPSAKLWFEGSSTAKTPTTKATKTAPIPEWLIMTCGVCPSEYKRIGKVCGRFVLSLEENSSEFTNFLPFDSYCSFFYKQCESKYNGDTMAFVAEGDCKKQLDDMYLKRGLGDPKSRVKNFISKLKYLKDTYKSTPFG